MEIVGYAAFIVIGLSLGLIGGGGSILTIPVLVYFFDNDPVVSTAYSLFVVGLTSLIGSIGHFKNGHVQMHTAIYFGLPSVISVFTVRKFLLPLIPDPVFYIGPAFALTKSHFIMILFALLMIAASLSMIRKSGGEGVERKLRRNDVNLMFMGLWVGAITGLLGAGGGFLIIPALVVLGGLPMRHAVGTSLVIIAINSLVGIIGDMNSGIPIDYPFLIVFSGLAIIGILIGVKLSHYISNEKLKPAFGWFVLVLGIYVLFKELIL